MKVAILERAQRDLLAGYWFYEKQAPGVGARFLHELETLIDSLRDTAGIHRRVHGRYRWAISRKFSHAVYYHVEGDTAYVDAVIDCRSCHDAAKVIGGQLQDGDLPTR